jgi:NAD(P)H-dependent FMN reductase
VAIVTVDDLPHGPDDAEITAPLELAVLIGSSRKGRIGRVVADWFVQRAGERELKIDVIDLAELSLPLDLQPDDAVRDLAERVGAADAVVMVTPEYNHGYPAALKLAIDSLRSEWMAKPVGFVSYGGLSGGLRAVEQLRQVCAELHMVSLRDTVSFHQVHARFDATGRLRHPDPAAAAADRLLDGIAWWGWALRRARAARRYPS